MASLRPSDTSALHVSPNTKLAPTLFPDSTSPLRVRTVLCRTFWACTTSCLGFLWICIHRFMLLVGMNIERKKVPSRSSPLVLPRVWPVANFLTPNQHIFMSSASTNADSSDLEPLIRPDTAPLETTAKWNCPWRDGKLLYNLTINLNKCVAPIFPISNTELADKWSKHLKLIWDTQCLITYP